MVRRTNLSLVGQSLRVLILVTRGGVANLLCRGLLAFRLQRRADIIGDTFHVIAHLLCSTVSKASAEDNPSNERVSRVAEHPKPTYVRLLRVRLKGSTSLIGERLATSIGHYEQ